MSQKINLDVTPGLFTQVLHFHQGDVGRQFQIKVVTRDGYEIPSGATFKIEGTKPSDLGFSVSGTASGNVITFTTTTEMTDEAGNIPAQLRITSGDTVIFASNFLMSVEANAHPDTVVDGSIDQFIPEMTLLVERLETAAATVEDAASLAPRISTAESEIDVLDRRIDEIIAPSGSAPSAAEVTDARIGADGTTYSSLGTAIRTQVTDLKNEISDISELSTSTNVYDESAGIAQRYVNESSGALEIGGSYTAWDYMDISQWDTIVISRYGTLAIALRYALFDENKTYISGALYTGSGTVDEDTRMTYLEIPRNGAKYIRISYLTEFISPNVMFSVGGANFYQPCITDTIPKGTESVKTLENFVMGQKMPMAKADTMVGWSYLALTDNNIQSGDEIVFYGRLTTAMGRIDIGHLTYNPSETGLRFVIDGSAIVWITNGSPSAPVYHGLSIKDYIRISVKIYRNGNYDIRIDTNGGTYIRNGNTFYNGYYGSVRVDVYNMTLVDCALMQAIPTLMSKVWVFGDSYLSYSADRWSYYMYEDGIRDVLINGFPGQASASAYDSFTELIKYGTPQYVIWALGMNDGDYASEINPSWQVKTQNVINACIEKGITPILCTIPNVPNIKNTLKNNFVRASGLQYIDFAKAVNADTEGATWYDGMLSSDDTHPTADGAKALYSRFLVDFPQIFNRNNNTLI